MNIEEKQKEFYTEFGQKEDELGYFGWQSETDIGSVWEWVAKNLRQSLEQLINNSLKGQNR